MSELSPGDKDYIEAISKLTEEAKQSLSEFERQLAHQLRLTEKSLEFRVKLFANVQKRILVTFDEGFATGVTDSRSNDENMSKFTASPPKNAELLFLLLLNKEEQEAAIGCFSELYAKRVVRLGKVRAWIWAWCEVAKTAGAVFKRLALKVSGLVAAYEWLKHHLS